jgi:hypothetical protein
LSRSTFNPNFTLAIVEGSPRRALVYIKFRCLIQDA